MTVGTDDPAGSPPVAEQAPIATRRSWRVRAWRELRRAPPSAWFGLVVLALYLIAALFAPVIAPYSETQLVGPGYAPWSEGLGLTLQRLADELPGRDLLVCEHGVGTDDDEWREEILKGSLDQVAAAIDDGVPVKGFFHWTSVDNYEWLHGFDVPFGLFDRDRNARPSAALLPRR